MQHRYVMFAAGLSLCCVAGDAFADTHVESVSTSFTLSRNGSQTRILAVPRFDTQNGTRVLESVTMQFGSEGRYDYRIAYSGNGVEGQARPFAGVNFSSEFLGFVATYSNGPVGGTVWSAATPWMPPPSFITLPRVSRVAEIETNLSAFTAPAPGSTWSISTTAQAVVFLEIQRGPASFWSLSNDSLAVDLDIDVIYTFSVLPCPGDIADDFGSLGGDGQVSFGDFLALLGLVGPCPGGAPGCPGDIADDFGVVNGGDGQVSFGDFLALLGLVGPCS